MRLLCKEGAMVPTPLPFDDGGNDRVSTLQLDLRLDDAEVITAERTNGAAEASFDEALAIVPHEEPTTASPRLADRIEAICELAKTDDGGQPAEALVPSASPAPAVALIEVPEEPQPTPEPDPPPAVDALDAIPPTPLLALAEEAVPDTPAVSGAEQAAVATPQAATDEPAGEVVSAKPVEAHELSADEPLSDAALALKLEATGQPRNVSSLANALDAAVKLAEDANAAAEALENLKRLLERRLPEVAVPPAQAPAALEATVAEPPEAAAIPPPLPLLPAVRNPSGAAALRPAMPPKAPQRVPSERRRFDVRGFLAGFALSWAFGVVLYLFLTAG
jgi:hypothetical protein